MKKEIKIQTELLHSIISKAGIPEATLYLVLLSYRDKSGIATVKRDTLSKDIGLSSRETGRLLNHLHKGGFIKWARGMEGINQYVFLCEIGSVD